MEEITIVDQRAELEKLVMLREDLRRLQLLARQLTPDQRLVLASQLGLQMGCREFCRRYGWTAEKYRKVAQRARSRLSRLLESDGAGVPPRRRASEEGTGTDL
jgi:DNA-directed RNA polymerase specialized sigma24 family protein